MYSPKKLIKSSNIFDAVKPFYYFSKILGTAPFTVTVKDNIPHLKTTRIDYIICTSFNVLQLFLLYFFTKQNSNSNMNLSIFQALSNTSNLRQNFMLAVTITSTIFFNLINFLFRKHTMEIITEYMKIDFQMSLLHIEVDHKAQSRITIKFIILSFLLVLFLTAITGSIFLFTAASENILFDLSKSFSLTLTNVFYANVVSQFVVSIISAYERFKKLNEGFTEMFKMNKLKEEEDLSHFVKRISRIHDDLIENIERINYRFSAWIMIIFASVFVLSTISIFTFLRALIIFDPKLLIIAVPRFVWSLYFVMFLLMVIATGSATTRIVFNFKCKIFKKMYFNIILFFRE